MSFRSGRFSPFKSHILIPSCLFLSEHRSLTFEDKLKVKALKMFLKPVPPNRVYELIKVVYPKLLFCLMKDTMMN